ncbi:unnamed protein product [Hermetia illucens]|uniref:Uncharacterized protein n=1 Tax=Hermetia illucens TaxID=343691 RepID=A0A7R8YUB7_HERIL|nr:general odorant-binding protein lush [Hermetia illucens]CAD7082604.1 unnamed protein product [Hermetia illucens]
MKTIKILFLFSFSGYLKLYDCLSMKQFDASLNTMRSLCQPKHKVSVEMLDNLRKGIFVEDRELKCYTRCIAQMTGTLSKKGDIINQRMLAQIDIIVPDELRPLAREAFLHCQDVPKDYKESCDKVFYLTKCVQAYSPEHFKFP